MHIRTFVLVGVVLLLGGCDKSRLQDSAPVVASPSANPAASAIPTPVARNASPSPSATADINSFTAPMPTPFCGEAGWTFLVNQYFAPHCASCHQTKGFATPPFADPNPDVAYGAGKNIIAGTMSQFLTQNSFCDGQCDLSPDGQVYKAIMDWLNNEFVCPTPTPTP